MSAVMGYVLGYEDGRSAAEISRRNREIVDRSSTANALFRSISRTSIQLHQLVEKFRSDSDHNL